MLLKSYLLVCYFSRPSDPDEVYDHHRQLSYKDVLARDERRFKAADTDSDGQLNREEFATFLHPGMREGGGGGGGGGLDVCACVDYLSCIK